MRKKLFLLITVILTLFSSSLFGQNKKNVPLPKVENLQREIRRLQLELTECQKNKVSVENTRRDEAISSLKAIRSVLDTGANFQEFKKYQLESRILIDVLPNVPENQVIKEISDLYKDAVTFGITRLTGTINNSELETARSKYQNDKDLIKILDDLRPNSESRGLAHDLNQVDAAAISQILILQAGMKLSKLK
ncbi:MAG: hypothetical protein NT096_12515 [Proteobacteria bacterium]|nr:hypothetical protein [Pseudomonadota bacterium]